MQQTSQGTRKEVIILKETENPQVNDKANGEQKLLAAAACDLQPNPQEVIDHGGGQDEDDESRIPPHVEHVACEYQQHFPYAKRHAVEQHRHDQKKHPVLEAIE